MVFVEHRMLGPCMAGRCNSCPGTESTTPVLRISPVSDFFFGGKVYYCTCDCHERKMVLREKIEKDISCFLALHPDASRLTAIQYLRKVRGLRVSARPHLREIRAAQKPTGDDFQAHIHS